MPAYEGYCEAAATVWPATEPSMPGYELNDEPYWLTDDEWNEAEPVTAVDTVTAAAAALYTDDELTASLLTAYVFT